MGCFRSIPLNTVIPENGDNKPITRMLRRRSTSAMQKHKRTEPIVFRDELTQNIELWNMFEKELSMDAILIVRRTWNIIICKQDTDKEVLSEMTSNYSSINVSSSSSLCERRNEDVLKSPLVKKSFMFPQPIPENNLLEEQVQNTLIIEHKLKSAKKEQNERMCEFVIDCCTKMFVLDPIQTEIIRKNFRFQGSLISGILKLLLHKFKDNHEEEVYIDKFILTNNYINNSILNLIFKSLLLTLSGWKDIFIPFPTNYEKMWRDVFVVCSIKIEKQMNKLSC